MIDDGTGDCSGCGKLMLYTDRPGAARPTHCWDCGSGKLLEPIVRVFVDVEFTEEPEEPPGGQ